MDIQQGNVVTQEMVAKLRPGMTREQVRFVLGTPLVVDPFRTDRWDYVYRYEKAGEPVEHRHIAVIFRDNRLARIEGDVVPAPRARASDGRPPAENPHAAPAAARAAAGQPETAGAEERRESGPPAKPRPDSERGVFGPMLERRGW